MQDLEGGSLWYLCRNGRWTVIGDLILAYPHTHSAFSFGVVIVFQIITTQILNNTKWQFILIQTYIKFNSAKNLKPYKIFYQKPQYSTFYVFSAI